MSPKKKQKKTKTTRDWMQERGNLLGLCCTRTGHLGSADHPTNPATKLTLLFPSMYQVPRTRNLPISFQQSQSVGNGERRHKPKLNLSWLKGCSWYATWTLRNTCCHSSDSNSSPLGNVWGTGITFNSLSFFTLYIVKKQEVRNKEMNLESLCIKPYI